MTVLSLSSMVLEAQTECERGSQGQKSFNHQGAKGNKEVVDPCNLILYISC